MALPKEDGVSEDPRTPGDPSGGGYEAPRDPYADYNGGSPPDAPLKEGFGWEWTGSRWEQVVGRGLGFSGGKTHNVVKGPDGKPDPYLDYNSGSPPNAPLDAGKKWNWNGSRWEQVAIGGGATGGGGATVPTTPRVTTSGVAGVPPVYAATATPRTVAAPGTSPIGGNVPSWDQAVTLARQTFTAPQMQRATMPLPEIAAPTAGPQIERPAAFAPPSFEGEADRNRIMRAILAQPEVMGQTFQDALFEQQKEQQAQMAAQARARLSQTTAARGLSAAGGQELLGQAGVEEGFINNLLAARRDVSTKAAEANRASSMAAVEMANAVQQGDFARAQAAYETQLKANQIYDQLRLQASDQERQAMQAYNQLRLAAAEQEQQRVNAANQFQLQASELDRGNVALAAQNLLAQREMQVGEQGQSFDQYLRQLQMNEMIRQFNEQMALNYGKFGWEQQVGLAGLFPR